MTNTLNNQNSPPKYLSYLLKFAGVIFIILVILSFFAKKEITTKIAEIANLECDKVQVNLLLRKATLSKIKYQIIDNNVDTSFVKKSN